MKVRPKEDRDARVVGAIYLEPRDAQVVRMAFNFTHAAFLDAALEDLFVVIENSLVNSRFWLPRRQEIETGLRGADAAAADEVSKLRTAASEKGAGPAPLPTADFEARRQEVLALLEAVEAADPALKPRTAGDRRSRHQGRVLDDAGYSRAGPGACTDGSAVGASCLRFCAGEPNRRSGDRRRPATKLSRTSRSLTGEVRHR